MEPCEELSYLQGPAPKVPAKLPPTLSLTYLLFIGLLGPFSPRMWAPFTITIFQNRKLRG